MQKEKKLYEQELVDLFEEYKVKEIIEEYLIGGLFADFEWN